MLPSSPQAASGSPPPPSPTLCVVCRNSIPEGALKCTECGSFQNWRRHLDFSSLVLSLLVALLSVSGIVIPALYKTLNPPKSQVQSALILMHPIDVHPLRAYEIGKLRYTLPLEILITNSGDRSALLTGFSVNLSGAGQPSDKGLAARFELLQVSQSVSGVLPLTLEPGAFKPVRLLVEMNPSDSLPQDWSRSEVRHSDTIKSTVQLGGSIKLNFLNSRAAHESITINLPARSTAFSVSAEGIFKNWRLRS